LKPALWQFSLSKTQKKKPTVVRLTISRRGKKTPFAFFQAKSAHQQHNKRPLIGALRYSSAAGHYFFSALPVLDTPSC